MGLLNQKFTATCMALTVPVLARYTLTSTASAVSSGMSIAFGERNGTLHIDGETQSLSPITSMCELSNGDLLVGCSEGLHCYRGAEEVWGIPLETGVDGIHDRVIIDGLGRAHVVNTDGTILALDAESVLHVAVSKTIALSTESGSVITYSLDGQRLWTRPNRGEVGERITAIGWHSSHLVVAREGHGLVPGEEEALEVEIWDGEVLEKRFDVKHRVIAIDGPWMGLDMGGVMFEGEVVAELSHPTHTVIDRGEHCLAGSWFHLHRISSTGIEWSVETQGMVEQVSCNSDGTSVLIAGSDQNDYTDAEPVVQIDSNATPVSIIEEETTLDDWGDAPTIEIDASELYGDTQSIEDIAGIEAAPSMEGSDLLSALEEEVESIEPEEDEDDLMLSLSLDAEEIIAPSCDAGGDQQVTADEDGTAVVSLDGSGTDDPQERIVQWSWIDGTGREIGTAERLRVKLMRGSHRFELRIRDSDGRWSSDSLDVRVE